MSDLPSKKDAIERLRRLKNLPADRHNQFDFEDGFQWGRRWAMATATPQELERLESLRKQAEQHSLPQDERNGKEMMRRIALVVTGHPLPPRSDPRRKQIPPAAREFWPVNVGLPERPGDCRSFAQGFCEGAMQFWHEVKDQI